MSPRTHHPVNNSSSNNARRPGGSGRLISTTTALLMVATAIPSFFLGTLVSLYAGIHDGSSHSSAAVSSELMFQSQKLQQQTDRKTREECVVSKTSTSRSTEDLFPFDDFGRYVVGMARVDKVDFIQTVDPGVPVDSPSTGANDVLFLYSHKSAMPQKKVSQDGNTNNPKLTMEQAVQNCNQVNVILADHSGTRKQCFAIVPQYESYHIQKWMRVPEKTILKLGSSAAGAEQRRDAKKKKSVVPLRLVSRGQVETGRDAFKPPPLDKTREFWELLKSFLTNVDDVLAELEPLLKKIAVNKTVIVMVCNFGQSELLMNFVCAAKARGLNTDNIIVFTTDPETTELATALGLTAFYDHRNFDYIPAAAARRYGDPKFIAMMMAKVICVQLVSMLGYDFLFQDVDIVWYQDPLKYFVGLDDYDVFFQDDGGHSLRYAPYSANSGFYFVRHNDRTRHFLTALLVGGGDLIISTKSHQQALIAFLQEHVSLHGLRAKVLSRDMEEFPGGYQFNQKSGKYMRALFAGELHPYIFHMSWTLNKDNKLLYFRQMGEWFVQDKCIAKKLDEIVSKDSSATEDIRPLCCAAEPLVSCHYRDKPSKIPCKDSPPIDKGRASFW